MASFVSLFLPTRIVRNKGLPIAEFFIWSDDWEYTRRISREEPCYVVPASRVIHAMKNPGTVNIATDVPTRWDRYRYFYRNDVVLYRREGWKGWLWLLAKDFWHTVQVLRDPRGKRLARIAIIWKGFAAGVRFRAPNCLFAMNITNTIVRLAAPYPAVAFDVFDTLIKRDVAKPTDVFLLQGTDFARARVCAEQAARAQNTGEITLPQIYAQPGMEKFDPAEECAWENKVVVPYALVQEAVRLLRAQGKRVYYISDMYLPPEQIAAMLDRCGYPPFDGGFVSSAYGVQKRSGALFRRFFAGNRVQGAETFCLWGTAGVPTLQALLWLEFAPGICQRNRRRKPLFRTARSRLLPPIMKRLYPVGETGLDSPCWALWKWLFASGFMRAERNIRRRGCFSWHGTCI